MAMNFSPSYLFRDERYQTAAEKALAFIKNQFNVSMMQARVSFGYDIGDGETWNVVWGRVESEYMEDNYSREGHSGISLDDDYRYDYEGVVEGSVDSQYVGGDYIVKVFFYTDQEYSFDCSINSAGRWATRFYYLTTEHYGEYRWTVPAWVDPETGVVHPEEKQILGGFQDESDVVQVDYSEWTDFGPDVQVIEKGTDASRAQVFTVCTVPPLTYEEVSIAPNLIDAKYRTTEDYIIPGESIKMPYICTSGGERVQCSRGKYNSDVYVRLFCLSDSEYLVAQVPIYRDDGGMNFFYYPAMPEGRKIAKVTENKDVNPQVVERLCGVASSQMPSPVVPDVNWVNMYWGESYADEYVGDYVWGYADGSLANLDGIVIKWPTYIVMPQFYSPNYTGTVWCTVRMNQLIANYKQLKNRTDITASFFKLRLYNIRDQKYVIDTVSAQQIQIGTDPDTGQPIYEWRFYGYYSQKGVHEMRLFYIDPATHREEEIENVLGTVSTNWAKARLGSYTDAFYVAEDVNFWAVTSSYFFFYSSRVGRGTKIAECIYFQRQPSQQVVNVFGIAGAQANLESGALPASFLIPLDDPQYNKDGSTALGMYGYCLNNRTWAYDVGLVLLVLATSGDFSLCRTMMNRMYYEQQINGDGSFNFSYDIYIGQLFERYVRTGAMGWIVWGMCYYVMSSGDRDEKWIKMIAEATAFIVGRQITDEEDPRYGLLTGGYGAYNMDDYSYIDIEIKWCSTEHNCSALQALWGASMVLHSVTYDHTNPDDPHKRWYEIGQESKRAAQLVQTGLMTTLWDKENNRFLQGVGDPAWALDCTTWAGTQALSIINAYYADGCLETSLSVYYTTGRSLVRSTEMNRYNQKYSSGTTFSGFKPYSDRTPDYEGAPDLVWSEGTLGFVLIAHRLGYENLAKRFMDETIKLQNVSGSTGGVLYTTATYGELPWEFHTWESNVSSAWLYLLVKNPGCLFPVMLREPPYKAKILRAEDCRCINLDFVGGVTTYFKGSKLTYKNCKLWAIHNNGTIANVIKAATLTMPIGMTLTQVGDFTCEATYTHANDTLTSTLGISVINDETTGIFIGAEPDKRTYYIGDSFGSAGIVIIALQRSGILVDVTDLCTCNIAEGTQFTTQGNRIATYTYVGETGTFTTTWSFTVNRI